jgi:hypothetical protein
MNPSFLFVPANSVNLQDDEPENLTAYEKSNDAGQDPLVVYSSGESFIATYQFRPDKTKGTKFEGVKFSATPTGPGVYTLTPLASRDFR